MFTAFMDVLPETVQWFSNGVWQPIPHKHFLVNHLHQHFHKQRKKMPASQQEVWAKVYKDMLLKRDIVHVNHIAFRLKVA